MCVCVGGIHLRPSWPSVLAVTVAFHMKYVCMYLILNFTFHTVVIPPPSLSFPLQLGSPFRDPVMKFALKFPTQTVDFFLCRLSDTALSRIFHFFLRHKDGGPLKDALAVGSQKLISATFALPVSTSEVRSTDGILHFILGCLFGDESSK